MEEWEESLSMYRITPVPPRENDLQRHINRYLTEKDKTYFEWFLRYYERIINEKVMGIVQDYAMTGHFTGIKQSYITGTWLTLQKYDPNRGVLFIVYKEYAAMRLYAEQGNKYDEDTLRLIAGQEDISEKTVREVILAGLRSTQFVEYYRTYADEDSEESREEIAADETSETETLFFRLERAEAVMAAFESLDYRERAVVSAHLGFCMECYSVTDRGQPFIDIAIDHGLSPPRYGGQNLPQSLAENENGTGEKLPTESVIEKLTFLLGTKRPIACKIPITKTSHVQKWRYQVIISRSSKRKFALFAAAVLLCGFLNVAFDGVNFTECFSRLYYGVLVLLWALSVQERITNARLRNLLLLIASQILLCSLLQAFRYRLFFNHMTVQRYLKYAHYVPMVAIALLLLGVSLSIYRPKEKSLFNAIWLPVGIGILLSVGILTNDIHSLAFRFQGQSLIDCDNGVRGWLIYLFMIFVFAVAFSSVIIIFRKRQKYISRKWCFIPILPILFEVLYAILYALKLAPQNGGIYYWDYGEVFSICTIAFLELCIQLGMLPANKDYGKLFSAASYSAVILNRSGDPVYSTAGARYPFQQSDDVRIVKHEIQGGSIEYSVNVKHNRILTQQLVDTTQQLEARNNYLAEDNRIKRELEAASIRNRLYDRISQVIHPQLSTIDALMSDVEQPFEKKLPKIAVVKTYIKRRCNLELLGSSDPLPAGELTAAITESLECMRLCGIHTSIASFCTGAFPAHMLIAAYEQFETVIEESFDTLSYINVSVTSVKKSLILRLMLNTDSFTYEWNNKKTEYKGILCKATVTKEKQDINIAFAFEEGGAHL